jgi:hypothetical protein
MKMKTTLLLLFSIITINSYSQNPINSYASIPLSNYAIATSSTAIDQTTAGANINWNFNTLASTGNSIDTYSNPTTAELTSYPNTTSVTTITSTVGLTNTVNKLYTKNVSNAISITAVKGNGLELNYATNNALLGTFPLSYGYSNTDNTAGNYIYTTYSGTFTGTITTTVDAYGLLTTNIPGILPNTPVTRLKTVQNINLNYSFFTNIGTAVQTSYSYYSASNLIFRSTTIAINVPTLSINQTTSQIESFSNISLGVAENNFLSSQIKITPNPAQDNLNIALNNEQAINLLVISDLSGKTILKVNNPGKSFPINHFQNGIYLATITTETGTATHKFIKE